MAKTGVAYFGGSSSSLGGGAAEALSNLTDIVLDYNGKMREIPVGLETLTSLTRFTASNCDIRNIDESITFCEGLFLIDLHSNTKLSKIPVKLSAMANIIAICIDDTAIDKDIIKELTRNKRSGEVSIIKYDF